MAYAWVYVVIVLQWIRLSKAANLSYAPNWESLDQRPLPQWYDEAKFGIFLHWEVYSVPGFKNEWFWDHMVNNETSVMQFMKENYRPGFTYSDFVTKFRAELFNATEWANIFYNSGARYVVLTSKHHDGYAMWPSAWRPGWNSLDTGPHRDIVGELGKAIKQTGMRFGLYYSLLEWFNPLYMKDKWSGFRNQVFVNTTMLPEMRHIVMRYLPDIVWGDGHWETTSKYFQSKEFLAWLYNESPVKESVVVNDRWGNETNGKHGGFYNGADQLNPRVLQKHKWENCMTIDKNSWGYRRNVDISEYLTLCEIVEQLVSTVSCGGNLLLNVGPTSEGTIAPIFLQRLQGLGKWLRINGEAIYNTVPWVYQNDTLNRHVWYTQPRENRHNIYAIILKWPVGGVLKVKALLRLVDTISCVCMLGGKQNLTWSVVHSQFTVSLPSMSMTPSSLAWTLAVHTHEKHSHMHAP